MPCGGLSKTPESTTVSLKFLAKNDRKMHDLGATQGENGLKMQVHPTPQGQSYTLSFTGNPQCINGIFMDGCRNVGENQKTFFEE